MSATQNNNALKYLAKNVLLLTISNFASKILVFFLIPLYTAVLTTEEYGTFDLFSTTVSLLIPILTANISDSVLRFSLESGANHKSIFGIGLRYVFLSMVVVILGTLALVAFGLSPILSDWWPMFGLLYITHALHAVVSNFARGLDRVRDVALAGFVASVVLVSLNLLFLLALGMGLTGYFLASILSTVSQVVCLVVGGKMWLYVGRGSKNRELAQEMRRYSLPLTANSVAWWVNNVSDRYVVTWFCGVAENGIYAVSTKIPQIINVIQVIFNQAWVLSAVKEMDENDESGFFKKTYDAYGALMSFACSVLIVLDRPLASIMYSNEFFQAWRYAPFLMVSMVFGALSGHIGGIFAAAKDSRLYARSTVIGALVNVLVNLLTVPIVGPLGAAVATAVSYWVVWVIRRRIVLRHISIEFNLLRDYASYAVLVLQAVWLIAFEGTRFLLYGVELVFLLIILMLYRRELQMMSSYVPHAFAVVRNRFKGRGEKAIG